MSSKSKQADPIEYTQDFLTVQTVFKLHALTESHHLVPGKTPRYIYSEAYL